MFTNQTTYDRQVPTKIYNKGLTGCKNLNNLHTSKKERKNMYILNFSNKKNPEWNGDADKLYWVFKDK